MTFIKVIAATAAAATAGCAFHEILTSDDVSSLVRILGVAAALALVMLLASIPGIRNWCVRNAKKGGLIISILAPMVVQYFTQAVAAMAGVNQKYAGFAGNVAGNAVCLALAAFYSPFWKAFTIVVCAISIGSGLVGMFRKDEDIYEPAYA